jgi:hypothetical protein
MLTRDDGQERRSRLLLLNEGSALGRVAPRHWMSLTKRGSGPTISETAFLDGCSQLVDTSAGEEPRTADCNSASPIVIARELDQEFSSAEFWGCSRLPACMTRTRHSGTRGSSGCRAPRAEGARAPPVGSLWGASRLWVETSGHRNPPFAAPFHAGGGTRTPDTRIMIAGGLSGGVRGAGKTPIPCEDAGFRVRLSPVASCGLRCPRDAPRREGLSMPEDQVQGVVRAAASRARCGTSTGGQAAGTGHPRV